MNLKNIYEMQKELDKKIGERTDLNLPKPKKSKKAQVLALLVETAEFANEVQSFKYWKANKQINENKILEEFADVLHFLGSLGYQYKVDSDIEPLVASEDVNDQLSVLFSSITNAMHNLNKYVIAEIIALALGTVKILGYSNEEILKWYEIKNKINHERILNKY
ncbi:dUTP diphosphatase [Mycoplasmopsis gallinarum]|uniref:Dimeric dUTPase n=1 Tax=Mycoplasmopsis gallinarum TaxID=29557 RepID=A0A168RCG2_9BACT|nr:dUTP diphosphatase [Mycoplasmopsis gallinarum]OAB48837.1 Dimeric dUTPase [Mycoplasmopsis gallinarum]